MGASLTSTGRLRLLEQAFDQGIGHFDTAPLYGMGLAEEVVGRFARGRRGEITITTKFGLFPPAIHPIFRPMVPIARALQRRLRRRWNAQSQGLLIPSNASLHSPPAASPAEVPQSDPSAPLTTAPPAGEMESYPYNEAAIRGSLETSLRKIGSDYIDFYLLHECQSGHLNEEVIAFLDSLVQEGKIKHYGLASGRSASWNILNRWPEFRGVVQIYDHLWQSDTEWFAKNAPAPLFTHSVLQTPLSSPALRPRLDLLLSRWGERTGQDPMRPGLLGELLLVGGLLNNPEGCVLFSTSRADRIASHVQILERMDTVAPPLQDLLAEASGNGGGSEACF